MIRGLSAEQSYRRTKAIVKVVRQVHEITPHFGMAANVFEECCNLLKGIDQRETALSTPPERNISVLASLVHKHNILSKKKLELGQLEDLLVVSPVMDPIEMNSTQLSLERAVRTLQVCIPY
jgi:hypothetical protein